jgi:hypothetical protein
LDTLRSTTSSQLSAVTSRSLTFFGMLASCCAGSPHTFADRA